MASVPLVPRQVRDMPEVRELCERLVSGAIPAHVKIDAPPWAEIGQCTENVTRVVQEHGGEALYGWRLWETLPGLMIEAEFHAVWLDGDECSLDVSPSLFPGISQTVFLPDPNLSYEGKQIDNVRVPLTDEPLVQDFIEAQEAEFEAANRGELAEFHGYMPMTPELAAIKDRQGALLSQIVSKYY